MGALGKALHALEALDVSGNPLGSEGACALLLAHHDVSRPCRLRMDDVCVRPDSALPTLLMRAAEGQPIEAEALEVAGVHAAAARIVPKTTACNVMCATDRY